MLCIGHRGAAGHAPENTLRSIQTALDLRSPWVEIDVFAVEGRLVVFHDNRLERTSSGAGYLSERSFAYLRSLDAGQGEKIPTLEEVFDLMDHRAGLNIELKGPGTAELVVQQVMDRSLRGWSFEQILVSSFNHIELAKIKDLNLNIRTGALMYGIPLGYAAFAEALGAFSIHPSIDFINQRLVDDAHSRGFQVFAYTANDVHDIERMSKLGVDGAVSDYPDRVLEYMET
jgi:glycerophosphoryl diester phosphodiesterase